ncbi:MAG: hypothetical protein K9N51_05410, partial [Candidatus Pacebacteria bacterium]|nr:hypothetical protein [Candidatus Paceibacterota bacterium]
MVETLPLISLPGELRSGRTDNMEVSLSGDRGQILAFKKPATPDPFVNAQLTSVGADAEGRERFFISCICGQAGSASFLLTEAGEYTTYAWDDLTCVYAVAPEAGDCLWLAGGSNKVFTHLCLSSGQWEIFPVEGGRFITAGMALDWDTGKLFCGGQTELVSFDTRSRQTVRLYGQAEKPPDNFLYDHWRLPDGSYGFILETPGLSFLRWDPKKEKVSWQRLTDDSRHPAIGLVRWLKYVENGRIYLPHFGWLDGMTGDITPHERPP